MQIIHSYLQSHSVEIPKVSRITAHCGQHWTFWRPHELLCPTSLVFALSCCQETRSSRPDTATRNCIRTNRQRNACYTPSSLTACIHVSGIIRLRNPQWRLQSASKHNTTKYWPSHVCCSLLLLPSSSSIQQANCRHVGNEHGHRAHGSPACVIQIHVARIRQSSTFLFWSPDWQRYLSMQPQFSVRWGNLRLDEGGFPRHSVSVPPCGGCCINQWVSESYARFVPSKLCQWRFSPFQSLASGVIPPDIKLWRTTCLPPLHRSVIVTLMTITSSFRKRSDSFLRLQTTHVLIAPTLLTFIHNRLKVFSQHLVTISSFSTTIIGWWPTLIQRPTRIKRIRTHLNSSSTPSTCRLQIQLDQTRASSPSFIGFLLGSHWVESNNTFQHINYWLKTTALFTNTSGMNKNGIFNRSDS